MTVKLLKEKFGCEDVEITRMFSGVDEMSALLISDLAFPKIGSVPISTSKIVNLKNNHYDQFSDIEQAVLNGKPFDGPISNGYEEFLNLLQTNCNDTHISDTNILRYLLYTDKITVEKFIQHNPSLSSFDHELIIKKSSDNPKLALEHLKKISFLSYDLKQANLNIVAVDEDIENLSLPAQWHIIKNSRKGENEEICRRLYEKYKNNFDGSGEIFKRSFFFDN